MTSKPLDREEQHLINLAEHGDFRPLSDTEKSSIISAARAGKGKTISIRINDQDLEQIKAKAERSGIPYQTLINSILHRYVSGGILIQETL